jgi:hypothetical protein
MIHPRSGRCPPASAGRPTSRGERQRCSPTRSVDERVRAPRRPLVAVRSGTDRCLWHRSG